MSEANEQVLKNVADKLEAEGYPVPPAFKGKMTEEESLLLHVFLDHLYVQVMANLKQARKELEIFLKDAKDEGEAEEVLQWIVSLVDSLAEGYDIFADRIEAIPTLKVMEAFREKLEEELSYAYSISLDQLGQNGNANSN